MYLVEPSISGQMLILRVTGDVLLPVAIPFQEEICSLVYARRLPEVIIDLSQMGRMDNAALGVLVTVSTLFSKRGMRLFLFNPAKHIENLIKEVGIEKFFPIFATEDELKNHSLSESV
ncbi:MAG: STAS domain-containing protein [Desulfovibrio sp.]|nr:STAS domain-containing protein [Desulfovibrio sp.]